MSAEGDKPKAFSEERSEFCNIPIYSNGISKKELYGYTDKPKIKEESVTISTRGTIGFVCLRFNHMLQLLDWC
ncbi:restriction endonuclease subunit S [Winogradskyella sp.]|uniref:restriction endonuclease subunit S n=1 Tax=Winogradskyella sp. TaxID=1883156 RepID=UPI0034241606